MYIATCIDKFRDNNGNIFGYRLQIGDIKQFDIEAKKLKREILRNTINVTNLKLTSDGRLVGKTDCTKLVSSVKNKRPYDAESYLEFFNLLVPFMEKALKFKEDDLGGEIRSVNINPDTEILEKFRTALGDVVRFSGVECCTELEFVFTVNNKRGYFLIALTDFSSNKRIYIEQCEISRVNMKSDFKNMLKACEKYRSYYLDTVVK